MKVLIGTPIHQIKDYAMERWLENVARLQQHTPADLLLVDNSPGLDYVEKVRGYCVKYSVQNYKIEYLELDQTIGPYARIEMAQDFIRGEVLKKDYDAWFSWECDQIIPTDAVDKLIRIINGGDFDAVAHNCWARWDPTILNTDMGCTLIKRQCLAGDWFLPRGEGSATADSLERYERCPDRIRRLGGNCAEVFGVVTPIYHLDN